MIGERDKNLILRRKLVYYLPRYALEQVCAIHAIGLKRPWLSNADQLRINILDKWNNDPGVKSTVLRLLDEEVM